MYCAPGFSTTKFRYGEFFAFSVAAGLLARGHANKTYGYGALGGWDDKADNSAGVIVPLIPELVQPKSVVDVGCGPGRWLHVFPGTRRVKDILGMDGAWVPQDKLHVPKENFQVTDLTASLAIPGANLIWSSAWKWRNIWRQLRRKLCGFTARCLS